MLFFLLGNWFVLLVLEWRVVSILGYFGLLIIYCFFFDYIRFLWKLWLRCLELMVDCDIFKSYIGGKVVGFEERKDWLKFIYDGGF